MLDNIQGSNFSWLPSSTHHLCRKLHQNRLVSSEPYRSGKKILALLITLTVPRAIVIATADGAKRGTNTTTLHINKTTHNP